MSDKPPPSPKKGLEEPEAAYRQDDDELTEAGLLAWEERNRDALIAALREAQEEIARGEYYTLEQVMAELEAQAKRRQARKA